MRNVWVYPRRIIVLCLLSRNVSRGMTSPNFTPDVWAQIVGKWVLFESQVERVAYSYMGEF